MLDKVCTSLFLTETKEAGLILTLLSPLLVSQVLQESLGVLLPLVGIHFHQLFDFAADKIPKLLDAILHPPSQLLLSGPRAYQTKKKGGGAQLSIKATQTH